MNNQVNAVVPGPVTSATCSSAVQPAPVVCGEHGAASATPADIRELYDTTLEGPGTDGATTMALTLGVFDYPVNELVLEFIP